MNDSKNSLPDSHYFAIGKLSDGKWWVMNCQEVELTEEDIKQIYSIVVTWLQVRMSLAIGGETEDDTNTNKNQTEQPS